MPGGTSVKRVNPASVLAYGRDASASFGKIRAALVGLVDDVVEVHYYGPNAATFKRDAGTLASDFASALTSDMTAIAKAVQESTSNIAAALGGAPIRIEFTGGAVQVPAIAAGDGSVGADLAAMETLKTTVKNHFSAINQQFADHLKSLTATDWLGDAKNEAVQVVGRFTSDATNKTEEASAKINGFIDKQIDALRRGDR